MLHVISATFCPYVAIAYSARQVNDVIVTWLSKEVLTLRQVGRPPMGSERVTSRPRK